MLWFFVIPFTKLKYPKLYSDANVKVQKGEKRTLNIHILFRLVFVRNKLKLSER